VKSDRRSDSAKGERICAICCGREREVTIDCSYLIAAHRYEAGHRKPLALEEFPYPKIEFPVDFVYERWPVVAALSAAILRSQAQNKEGVDADILAALEALAETYRTLVTGIYYEHPPDRPVPSALYALIAESLKELQQQSSEQAGHPALRESDIFRLLVFLLRVGKQETNGRPRSRAFLSFLRSRFPFPAEAASEGPRIIVP
jgi:hypothetical protein